VEQAPPRPAAPQVDERSLQEGADPPPYADAPPPI